MSAFGPAFVARRNCWRFIAGGMAAVLTTACWSYQVSNGTFDLMASGGLSGPYRGKR